MRVHLEEAFGPVATLYRVADAATRRSQIANGTDVRSQLRRLDEGCRRAGLLRSTELDAGAVFINGMTISYPELPFGGIKNSGFGRELAAAGIREFCNLKTVWEH